jgi:hypothetical protein
MGSAIAAYQQHHQLDDLAMMQYLRIVHPLKYYLLHLCYRPPTNDDAYINEVGHISGYIRCDSRALLRVVIGVPGHLAWVEEERKRMWRCTAFVYQALIVRGEGPTYGAAIIVDNKKEWATLIFSTFDAARDWCEARLDALVAAFFQTA